MFELMKIHESAKNEKNKFLRYFLLKYSNYKLEKSFFKKFNVYHPNFEINKNFFMEFFQFYNCTHENAECSIMYPRIISVDSEKDLIVAHYKYFRFFVTIKDDECVIEINRFMIDIRKTKIVVDYKIFAHNVLGTIILMAIYNYCVSYIYGLKGKLYTDKDFTKLLCDLYF